jgi:uncharacterized protein
VSDSEKLSRLNAVLAAHSPLAIAFSGGVDSAFLLKAAVTALGADKVLAITARAVAFPDRENREATGLAEELGVRHLQLDFDVLSLPEFVANTPERCYHCKKALFEAMREEAGRNGFSTLADGANVDDEGDYRPGMRATKELGVISPLREAELRKADIRALSRGMGIVAWDKPSFACLASRFPYGQRITREDLARVEAAERYFLEQGWKNIRVRVHGDVARIEVDPGERVRFFDTEMMDRVDAAMRGLGFGYAALDLRGYRTGSMNEVL